MSEAWRRAREILRGAGLAALLAALVTVPTAAVAVAAFTPEEYRSEAVVAFSGRNTGYVTLDVERGRRALESYLSSQGLADDVELDVRPGHLEIAANRPRARDARTLGAELSAGLARQQGGRVASPAGKAVKVAPRLLETGLLGLALALPLGVTFAAALAAFGRRAARER